MSCNASIISSDLCYNIIKVAQRGTLMELSIREARNALGHLDEYLSKNGEIIITRHGKAIARILPLREQMTRPSHDDLKQKIGKFSIASVDLIRADRDER